MTCNGPFQPAACLQFCEMQIKRSSLPETKHFTKPSSQTVIVSRKRCFSRENLDSVSAGVIHLLLNSILELSLAWEKHIKLSLLFLPCPSVPGMGGQAVAHPYLRRDEYHGAHHLFFLVRMAEKLICRRTLWEKSTYSFTKFQLKNLLR